MFSRGNCTRAILCRLDLGSKSGFMPVSSKMAVNNICINSCFMHFIDIFESSFPITKTRLEKFIVCRQRWVNLQCEQSEICRKSYEYFSDEALEEYLKGDAFELDWPFHKTCYKRLCDEEKIRRAEKKASSSIDSGKNVNKNVGECSNIECEKRRSSRLSERCLNAKRARSVDVLPKRCIICKRDSSWLKMDKVSSLNNSNEYFCQYLLIFILFKL